MLLALLFSFVVQARLGEEISNAHGYGNRGKDPPALSPAMQLLSPYFSELARGSHVGEQREAVEDLDWELALR
jgi:hypothetical protein